MRGRPVRVAVDDAAHAGHAQRGDDGIGCHVHDVRGLCRLLAVALHAQPAREGDALVERLRQEIPLELGLAHRRAKPLVRDVERAPGVAVRQQRGRAGDFHDDRVGEQCAAGGGREGVAEQGIAVAVHQQQAPAVGRVRGQCIDDGSRGGRGVVADPELEEVAEDDEFAMPRRVVGEEPQEARDRARPFRGEVQVRDEERVHERRGRRRDGKHRRRIGQAHSTISARSISTSDSGTSWCMPWRPVRTALILSTTSKPSVTLPKTQ